MPVDETVATSLLNALRLEEENLSQAASRLTQARTEYDLASSRFIAIRDLVTNRLGISPYAHGMFGKYNILLNQERYRFLGMSPADAAIEVLRESDDHLELENIADRLHKGGLRSANLLRSVNAALMNRGGVKRDDDGNYFYEEEKPEDIPFE